MIAICPEEYPKTNSPLMIETPIDVDLKNSFLTCIVVTILRGKIPFKLIEKDTNLFISLLKGVPISTVASEK
jgi:hypothetical protein